jgi:hypothetical protein
MIKLCITPGKWLIRIEGTSTGRGPEVYTANPHYDDGSEFVVAQCGTSEVRPGGEGEWQDDPDADVVRSNARLISAAPELIQRIGSAPTSRSGRSRANTTQVRWAGGSGEKCTRKSRGDAMSETRFTPGPWFVGAMNDCLFVIDQQPSPSGSDVPIDTPHPGLHVIVKVEGDNATPNAALIAAAPELYEALEKCADVLAASADWQGDGPSQVETDARAALAKARGESA